MKRIIQIVLLLLLINGTAFGQEKSDFPMDISIENRDPNQFIKLIITSPEGKITWNENSKNNIDIDTNYNLCNIKTSNWYSIPGSYILSLEVTDKNTLTSTNNSLHFSMNGAEQKTKVIIYFAKSSQNLGRFLAEFLLYNYYNSSDSVKLVENWLPSPKGKPTYTIINNSSVKIYDTYRNNFYGYIMKFESGEWEVYEPKDDLNSPYGNPLQSGDSIITVEKPFVGKVTEFVSGKYKYCIYYSHSDMKEEKFVPKVNSEKAHIRVLNFYLLEKEFTIE